eukprot:6455740-Amphidinium_carterae.1
MALHTHLRGFDPGIQFSLVLGSKRGFNDATHEALQGDASLRYKHQLTANRVRHLTGGAMRPSSTEAPCRRPGHTKRRAPAGVTTLACMRGQFRINHGDCAQICNVACLSHSSLGSAMANEEDTPQREPHEAEAEPTPIGNDDRQPIRPLQPQRPA